MRNVTLNEVRVVLVELFIYRTGTVFGIRSTRRNPISDKVKLKFQFQRQQCQPLAAR